MIEANAIKEASLKAVYIREPLETRLLNSGYARNAFTSYITFEKRQKPTCIAAVSTLYERALTIHCLDAALWEEYLVYMVCNYMRLNLFTH
jgi:hypothetical protein